jgi:glycosyltransferase involved in cell wall biosynthesis
MQSMTTSSVAALLPAYQAAGFIQPTLDALSAQTYPDFRIIVSVDVSNDDTWDLCQAHSRKDPRFQIIRHQGTPLGYIGNCNFLLNQAASDYAFFAFHDDIVLPGFVDALARALDQRPDAINAFCDVLCTDTKGQTRHWTYRALEGINTPMDRAIRVFQRAGHWYVPNRGMMRMAMVRSIRGGMRPHQGGTFSIDWSWLFHMSLLGAFVRVPEVLCHKFYQPESLSRQWAFNSRQWQAAAAACLRELWASSLTTEDKMQLSDTLNRQLLANLQPVQQKPMVTRHA